MVVTEKKADDDENKLLDIKLKFHNQSRTKQLLYPNLILYNPVNTFPMKVLKLINVSPIKTLRDIVLNGMMAFRFSISAVVLS